MAVRALARGRRPGRAQRPPGARRRRGRSRSARGERRARFHGGGVGAEVAGRTQRRCRGSWRAHVRGCTHLGRGGSRGAEVAARGRLPRSWCGAHRPPGADDLRRRTLHAERPRVAHALDGGVRAREPLRAQHGRRGPCAAEVARRARDRGGGSGRRVESRGGGLLHGRIRAHAPG